MVAACAERPKAKRECARAEGVGLAEGKARAAKRSQEPAWSNSGSIGVGLETKKGNGTMKKKLQDAIKGMQVESWEVREHSNGKRKVYVRFTQKKPVVTVDVNEG